MSGTAIDPAAWDTHRVTDWKQANYGIFYAP